ncbi:MAG: TetR/AcrR family transcriptional regulator [Solirubrobacteraceae bacterium]|nr:TetR/AcrR family transcriptional regulator [Solirubrobacteraceae bacterium]
MASPDTAKPLRADAERNRQRILEAARVVFSERGLGATLDDVAAEAGVGVGTVYRRFADKDALLDQLFDERIEEIVAIADEQLAAPDAWVALCTFLECSVALQAEDRGLRELIHHPERGLDRVRSARERLAPRVDRLLQRAQRDGAVRSDVKHTDIGMLTLMLVTAIQSTEAIRPDAWRRPLALAIDSLRPAAATGPLPGPALTVDEFDDALRTPRS